MGIAWQRSEAPRPLVSVFTATGERGNRDVMSSPDLALVSPHPLALMISVERIQRSAEAKETTVEENTHHGRDLRTNLHF